MVLVQLGRAPSTVSGHPGAPRWGGADAYDGDMSDYWAAVIWSLAPTVVVLGLFIFVLRSILRMDRTERRVYSRIEAEERAKRGLPAAGEKPAA